MFMSPTLTETGTGCAGRVGNRSALSWHTATTLLSVVSGSCGIPVNMIPASGRDSHLGNRQEGNPDCFFSLDCTHACLEVSGRPHMIQEISNLFSIRPSLARSRAARWAQSVACAARRGTV